MSQCYTQITLADRRRLHHLVAANVPVNEMARQLGRHRSTIYRRCYAQITLTDRRRQHHIVAANVPINEMARQLGRHRSTHTARSSAIGLTITNCRTMTAITARLSTELPKSGGAG